VKKLTGAMCALIVVLTLFSFAPQVRAASPSVVDYPVPGYVSKFKLDGESNPWFTWQDKLIRVNAGGSSYSTYSMPDGLYPYSPEAFDFDSEGNIWYAAAARDYQAKINTVNVVKFNYSQNSHQTYTFQFNDWDYGVNIRNVLVDKHDVVWIVNDNSTAGSNYRCLLEFNPAHPGQLPYYLMPDVTNTNLQVFDNDGNIWLTNYRNYLYKFDVVSHQYQTYRYPSDSVYQMPEGIDFDSSGNIWMALYNSGANLLVRYNPASGDYQVINIEFMGIGNLCVDSKDEVWVADSVTHSIARTDGVSVLDVFDRGDYYLLDLRAAPDGSVWSSECWFEGMYDCEARVSHFILATGPTDISLSNATIAEDLPAGTVVGILSADDSDTTDGFTFSITADPDCKFVISGSDLLLAATLDYEVATHHPVTIQVADGDGNLYAKDFTINVLDVNEPPVLAGIGNRTVDEGQSLLISVSAHDPEGNNLYLDALPVPDGASFDDYKDGTGRFLWNTDYDDAGTYKVTFTASDGELDEVEEVTIKVNDVNRPPVAQCRDIALPLNEDGCAILSPSDINDGSYDPDGDPLALSLDKDTFTCTDLGANTVTLTVSDGDLDNTCTATVTVVDITPPDLSISISPDTLWPPNHKMVEVNITVTVSDIADSSPQIILLSVTSNEPANAKGSGDGNTENDIQDEEIGTEDYSILLRAERDGNSNGRTYIITYRATDDSGNSSTASVTVTVPHDQEKDKDKGTKKHKEK
jgi:streptogramin lyase